jgi:hypothetical protein
MDSATANRMNNQLVFILISKACSVSEDKIRMSESVNLFVKWPISLIVAILEALTLTRLYFQFSLNKIVRTKIVNCSTE